MRPCIFFLPSCLRALHFPCATETGQDMRHPLLYAPREDRAIYGYVYHLHAIVSSLELCCSYLYTPSIQICCYPAPSGIQFCGSECGPMTQTLYVLPVPLSRAMLMCWCLTAGSLSACGCICLPIGSERSQLHRREGLLLSLLPVTLNHCVAVS